ncbi:hypothetical protein GPA10_02245 [Streptomyces sp. p1417]|uniref:Uncharacterized protein n=1 Tax=Streptomyces typhae TaxID=2681492 RepID=A0A6L6WMX1_9ACTN|nr:hypothetical protein [Streptomyces typhae]MVO83612.1 hypothetical protein [Streptomyces typhae]
MRIYDKDRQEWVGPEQERAIAALHDRDAGRQRTALRGAVAVLAVCGLAFGTWALGWKDEPKPTAYLTQPQPRPEPGTGTDGSGGDSDTTGTEDAAQPSPDGGPPSGYESVDDDEGFRTAVPEGWRRSGQQAQSGTSMDIVNYRSDDGSRRLQVYEVSEPSPMASLQVYLDDTQVPKSSGFEQLSLTSPDAPRPAARLTYRTDKITDEPDIGTWYVIDHRFEAEDGKIYALAAYGAEADGTQDEKELVATALKWFCPPLTYCPQPDGS